MRIVVYSAAIALLPLLGCWTFDPWVPEDFPRDRLFQRPALPKPSQAVYIRWYDLSIPPDAVDALQDLWRETDEQIVPLELRPLLQANGFRVGVLADRLPASLRQRISQGNTPLQIYTLLVTPGKPHFQPMGSKQAFLTCPVHYLGECSVAEFPEAQPGLVLEITDRDTSCNRLTITPVIRHRQREAIKLLWAQEASWPTATGETETRFAFLNIAVNLSPKDILVIGANRGFERSLGSCFFDGPRIGETRLAVLRQALSMEKLPSPQENQGVFPNFAKSFATEEKGAKP